MADGARLPLLQRLFPGFARAASPPPNGNGKGTGPGGSGVTIVPGISFTSNGGTRELIQIVGGGSSEAERVSVGTAYAAAAYAYAAMRWRASRISEPPLMVVQEDQDTGDEEWLPKHPLAELLEEPSPDYDMGELLFRTSIYVDQTGHALWLKDTNGVGAGFPGRLTPFNGGEFEIVQTADRMRGAFKIQTARGEKTVKPEQVVYFHEPDPNNWLRGLSRLEVFMGWLNLGQVARATVRDLLSNAVWPSVILQPDAEWNPSPDDFEQYKAEVDSYSQPGRRGKALAMLGGGTATAISARVRDLVPDEVFNRVESVASSVFGAPAIVLQFMVGMQNSPWSQMAEARKMGYEDTIEPGWRDIEKRLTRQLLRPLDSDRSHLVRFDTTQVRALQADDVKQAQVATAWGRQASLNERRAKLGLEPSDDPKADDIPELTTPVVNPFAPGGAGSEDAGDTAESAAGKALSLKRSLVAALRADQVARAQFDWEVASRRQLEVDRAAIVALAEQHLASGKADTPGPGARRSFFTALVGYLEGTSKLAWAKHVGPLAASTAERGAAPVVADMGISFNVLRPGLAAYAKREAAWLVTNISDTTRDAVQNAVASGIEAGQGAAEIAKGLRDLPAFSRTRALLVARTEATRITNGAPTEALQARQETTGRQFTKTWRGALDDRERDEHVAMEGETVGVAEPFSNGLQFPSEPNCRCVLVYQEAEG